MRSFQHVQVHKALGFIPPRRAHLQQTQRDDQRGDGPAHPDRAEPVVFLALVEDDLQAAGPDDQQAEADVVEGADLGVLDVRRKIISKKLKYFLLKMFLI